MKHFSRFYFIDKVLRKTLAAIRRYSLVSKISTHLKVKNMRDCFGALRHHADVNKAVRLLQIRSIVNRLQQVIHKWSQVARIKARDA